MREVKLLRKPSGPDGVLGRMLLDDGWLCSTIERPDLDDAPDVSCIAEGRFECRMAWSAAHQRDLYHVAEPRRKDVEIHAANVMEQLKGCIALGRGIDMFKAGSLHPGVPSRDMLGVTGSVDTLEEFHRRMLGQPFVLVVSKESA